MASPLETSWTLIAVLGLLFTAWAVQDNWSNFQAVRDGVRRHVAVEWGPRYWMALGSLVSSVLIFVVWLGFATIGIFAMSVPPPMTPDRQAANATIGWVLIGMEAVLLSVQVWQVFVRTRLRRFGMPVPHRPEPTS